MTQDESDATSTFSYDGEGDPDTFSLHELNAVANAHFGGTACRLEKMAEGGYHKVYAIVQDDGTHLGVARVAAPAFPRDKMESEVATLRYLAAHTRVPVPEVYASNSDASNPVGLEYMLMQKIPGFPASTKWDTLPMPVKERVVAQVAEHLKAIFALRFDRAGSLYLSESDCVRSETSTRSETGKESGFVVGPIVSTPFYRALDGVVRARDADDASYGAELARFRGPFVNTSDYLRSSVSAELHFIAHHRATELSALRLDWKDEEEDATARLERGERVLRKAFDLCAVYPGDTPIHGQDAGAPIEKPFSLRLDDFRLSNIMIDDSGRVTGIIDYEGATVAPLWECALLPRWLQDPDDPESSHEGGSAESRQVLRAKFLEAMGSEEGEWRSLYEKGKPFRAFTYRLTFQVGVWACIEEWVDERLVWAGQKPGVGFVEGDIIV